MDGVACSQNIDSVGVTLIPRTSGHPELHPFSYGSAMR